MVIIKTKTSATICIYYVLLGKNPWAVRQFPKSCLSPDSYLHPHFDAILSSR